MKKCLITLICALTLMLPQSAGAKHYKLVSAAFKPFTDPDHPKGGFLTEVARKAFAARGHTMDLEFRPWARAMAAAENGRYDALLSAFYNTERAAKFHFSAPLNTTQMVFVGLKDNFFGKHYRNLDELSSMTVAIGRKWAYSEEFDANSTIQKVIINDEEHGIKLLFNNRVDLFAVNLNQFQAIISGLDNYPINQTAVLTPAISTNDQHIAAPRQSPKSLELLAEFNTGLAAIKADGTYQKIRTEFFGF